MLTAEEKRRNHAKAVQKWKRKNREIHNIHCMVRYYRKKGDIEKQPCEKCGRPDSQAHHPDYEKPLSVVWLCPVCHGKEHRNSAL
jgi:hypothetical protein